MSIPFIYASSMVSKTDFISKVILLNNKKMEGGVASSFVYAKFYNNNFSGLVYTDAQTASIDSLSVETYYQRIFPNQEIVEGEFCSIDDLNHIGLNYLPVQYKEFSQKAAISLTNLQKEIPKYSLYELGLMYEKKCWNWVCHFKATKHSPIGEESFSLYYTFNGIKWEKCEPQKFDFWFSNFLDKEYPNSDT